MHTIGFIPAVRVWLNILKSKNEENNNKIKEKSYDSRKWSKSLSRNLTLIDDLKQIFINCKMEHKNKF